MLNIRLLTLLLIMITAACTVGPDYKRPKVEAPTAHRGTSSAADSIMEPQIAPVAPDQKTLGELTWWEFFEAPELQELIRTGIEQNYDLRIAGARILEARAQLGITRAGQLPEVNIGADTGRFQLSKNTGLGDVGRIGSGNLSVGSSWNIDFWGKFRRASEAARAELLASEENRLEVFRTLVTGIAVAYFQLRELDLEMEVARVTLESREVSLRLMRLREDRGISSMIEVYQAEVLVNPARTVMPSLEQRIEQKENEISILLGQNPGPINRGKALIDQRMTPNIPAGLPSNLLERRPDIRFAEQQLVAANARIGVAKANLFPQISLTGSAGFQSNALNTLLQGSSGIWSFAASLFQPIFQGGRLRSQVEVSEAVQQQALYSYMGTVQQAFREVADSLWSVTGKLESYGLSRKH